jgi:predicted RNA-binding Zn-ribbon protein involved in translation (DUF1610 family)
MEPVLTQALTDVRVAFALLKESIGLFKSAKDLLPDSAEKEAASTAMREAESKAKIAEAGLAKSLGFNVCPKCWPPFVLRATEVFDKADFFVCDNCGTHYKNMWKRKNEVRLQEYSREDQSHQQDNHE